MKSSDIKEAEFTILNGHGQMIGGATVAKRLMVIVTPVGSCQDIDPLSKLISEMQDFAEAEARRLGMLDE